MNITDIRQDTLGLSGKIFMNSAGASLMPGSVPETMIAYLRLEEQLGGYQAEIQSHEAIARFYTETAKLLNCGAHQIAFASNATNAYNQALSSIPFQAGDCILTSNDDYVSSQIAFFSLEKRYGIKIIRANNLKNGDLDLEHFEHLAKTYQPVLVSLTHIPTNSGLVQQAEAVSKICKKYNIWYLLDACQSVGQLPVDVQSLGCDFLSATGRKFLRGPRGTGFLYVSDKVLNKGLEPLLPDMRGAEWTDINQYQQVTNARRFELFETSYASLLGLTEAIRYANDIGMENIYRYNQQLSKKLRSQLAEIPDLEVLDHGSNLSNIITFRLLHQSLETIESRLSSAHVFYSVSRKKNALIDMDKKGVDWVIRFSPHYFNTLAEIDTLCEIVASISILK